MSHKSNFNLKGINFDKLVKDPAKYTKLLSIGDLENLLVSLKDYYYNTDQPLVPDFVYDEAEDVLRERKPDSKVLGLTDAKVSKGPTVKLPYYMHSQAKAKADSGDIQRWFRKYGGPYVISHKIDGISVELVYDQSLKQQTKIKLYTRGQEGIEGHDVTRHIRHLDLGRYDIPKHDKIAIRGELVVPITIWDKYYSQHPHVRNWTAGKINDKRPLIEDLKRIKLIAYEVIEPRMKPSEQMKQLKEWGFHVVPHFATEDLDEDELKKLLIQAEEKGPYQVDGLVISDDAIYPRPTRKDERPKYSIAYKMQMAGDEIQTMVQKVIWNPSKDMLLNPVVVVKPVKLSGATISRATAHNAKYVVSNKIGAGAIITIIRSGKVIPYIKSVDVAAPKTDLPHYKHVWAPDGLNFKLVDKNLEVYHRVLMHMTKHLEIDYLGEGVLKKLVEMGYLSPAEILNLSLNELKTVPSLGKNADKIYESLTKLTTKGVKLAVLMDASNIFPAGVGTRILQSVLNEIPDLLDRSGGGISGATGKSLKEDLVAIKGIQTKTAEKIMAGLPAFNKFLFEIPKVKVLDFEDSESDSDPGLVIDAFQGLRVVFTGVRDKELIELITNSGGIVANTVSKTEKNQVVVAKDPSSTSNKLEAARDQGIDIMSLSGFRKKYVD